MKHLAVVAFIALLLNAAHASNIVCLTVKDPNNYDAPAFLARLARGHGPPRRSPPRAERGEMDARKMTAAAGRHASFAENLARAGAWHCVDHTTLNV